MQKYRRKVNNIRQNMRLFKKKKSSLGLNQQGDPHR